jgi:S1-C subfamily serine protease
VSLGAAVRSVSPEVARERGLPATYGVEVGRVAEGSPASVAGILPGDLITAIGDSMTLTVRRGSDDLGVVVSFPEPAASQEQPAVQL